MSQFACSDCLHLSMLLVTQFTFKVVHETTNAKTIQTLALAFLYFPCDLYSFPISLREANGFNISYIRGYRIVFNIMTLGKLSYLSHGGKIIFRKQFSGIWSYSYSSKSQ